MLIIGMAQMDTKKTEDAKQNVPTVNQAFPRKKEAAKMAKESNVIAVKLFKRTGTVKVLFSSLKDIDSPSAVFWPFILKHTKEKKRAIMSTNKTNQTVPPANSACCGTASARQCNNLRKRVRGFIVLVLSALYGCRLLTGLAGGYFQYFLLYGRQIP